MAAFLHANKISKSGLYTFLKKKSCTPQILTFFEDLARPHMIQIVLMAGEVAVNNVRRKKWDIKIDNLL